MSETTENKILNEEERSLLLDHNYDGIEEFDYPLPSWWLWTFIGGIVFAVFYFFYYQVAGGPSLKDEYKADMAEVMEIRAQAAKETGLFQLASYNAYVGSVDIASVGLQVFDENCLSCHEEGGKGDIGPNLTDKHWLNLKSVTPESVYSFIVVGNEDNGMPAWGEVLSKEELYAATAYVLSLRNTMVPGKEPQGEIIE